MTTTTIYTNSIESAIQNLTYIKKQLEKGKYAKNGAMLEYALEEATEALQGNSFSYTMEYVHTDRTEHFVAYTSFAKMHRSKVLSQLEDIAVEFRSKKCNEQRCLVILNELLSSNLYRDKVQKQINKFTHLRGYPQIKTVSIQ
ncbi:hypothetical protein [Lysinibacillus capsici]|uniref:hypothetical protein n=1 Tax=Lysinibacillus capsici TaxID=2115968 RepID=UPI0034E25DDF